MFTLPLLNFVVVLDPDASQVGENAGGLTQANHSMEHTAALAALLKSQAELQNAVKELVGRIDKEGNAPRPPGAVLSKQSPEDDIEAYIEVFERTAAHERWPAAEWASILAPFLTGEAQRACRDLSTADARDFQKLKTAILSSHGYSLPARAQRFHAWTYQPGEAPRAQVAGLRRLAHRWLNSGEGPPWIERLVIDRCIRALPPDARKYAAQVSPLSLDALVALLENHQVSTEMMRASRSEPPRVTPREPASRDRRRALPPPNTSQPRPPPHAARAHQAPRRCYVCGQEDHISWDCPARDQDVSMASATSTDAARPCLHTGGPDQRHAYVPVKIGDADAHALVDSGSVITLVHADYADDLTTETVPVTCVHGDVKQYPVSYVAVRTPKGNVVVPAGVVPNLPVPLLLGTDFPLFPRFWGSGKRDLPAAPRRRGHRRRPASPPVRRVACPTFRPSTEGTPGSSSGPEEEDGGTPPPDQDAFAEFPVVDAVATGQRGEFATAQWEDPNLEAPRRNVMAIDGNLCPGVNELPNPHFCIRNGLLYRGVQAKGGDLVEQLLVPKKYVSRVLYLAHTHQLGAHLGVQKTFDRVVARFYWPGVKGAIEQFCRECPECQKTAPRPNFRNPLVPLPIIGTPFSRIAMDIVGPLSKSSRGHKYILVIVDYATRYPEAIPLRTANAKNVAHELMMLFSRVGIADEVLTDQGTCFMSRVMSSLYRWLKVKRIRTSVYHPQTDGLVERFNQTLKKMLKKLVEVDGRDWDQLIPYVLFAIREVPQASTGYSPFELLYGRRPRGLLDLAKEVWESQPSPHRSVIEHVERLQERAKKVWPTVREHMEKAQAAQARTYNRGASVREFQPGEKVLVLVPTTECKFLAKWQGPFEVVERVGPVNYRVSQPGRRKGLQIYHVNILKKWHTAEPLPYPALLSPVSPQTPEVALGEDLAPGQVQDMKELLSRSRDIFSELPGRTKVVQHDIETRPGQVVRQRPYRIPEARRTAIREEVKRMLDLGVIEESYSPWSSPIVIVPKPDGTLRFCNDFRKLNDISTFDAYPMPRVDELIERLGPARYVSTLDLTKGYWQVPLTPRARPKTAFATPDGLFQYRVLPFGVHGAPATFQRLMDQVLRPLRSFAAAYLDDIVVHSATWVQHLEHLEAVLGALRRAGLTANAKKCRLGWTETDYLGYTIGRGCVKPQVRKIEKIQQWPHPVTKKQVKSFLGLVGYYQKFVKNFATVAAPLHELTRKNLPHHVKWTREAEEAFQTLKKALCEEPVLVAPDFSKPFVLHTDASGTGIGAVLAQNVDGDEHPVTYISRKLLPHEKTYATVEKEGLAVKWAIHHLRYYLWGREFTLITDHAPLKWMALNKDRNERVTRWFVELQNYKFRVEHRPGKEMQHADAMSRMHEDDDHEAPGPSKELRGGKCGVSTLGCPRSGESLYCSTGVRRGGRVQLLGRVIDGRYVPRSILDQGDMLPAPPAGARLC